MDRNILKNTLQKQIVPMSEAVNRKLAYLKGEKVFAIEDEETTQTFTDLLIEEGKTTKPQPHIEPTEITDKIATHKQTVAEKIAALRGITATPGQYLNRKY
jgi:hypothetical protein